MTSPPTRLFIYGPLRSGHARAALLTTCRRRRASVRGALYHLREGYPALSLDGHGMVHGELVDPVPSGLLRILDHYKGVDEGLFRRTRVDALLPGGPLPAWSWVMDTPEARGGIRIRGGIWRRPTRR